MTAGTVLQDLMVPMRDGVRLATDVHLPPDVPADGGVRRPTLLTRTPYSKSTSIFLGALTTQSRSWSTPDAATAEEVYGIEEQARRFAARGYVVVAQDVRGRHGSEGEWSMLDRDGEDGADTCAWIARQPWSDGRVGMFGTSYAGGTQHAAALAGAPELATAIPVDAMANLGERGMRYDGAFELRFWNWVMTGGNTGDWGRGAARSRAALGEMAQHRRRYLRELPLRPGTTPLKHAPEYERWLVAAMEHGANDAFWAQNDILGDPTRYRDMPLLLVGGWYDSWAHSTTANHVALSAALESPVHLVMGPWVHGMQGDSTHGQVDFGPAAALADQLGWRLDWFDRWLMPGRGETGDGEGFGTPVRIFVMGTGSGGRTPAGLLDHGGSWRDETAWPPPRARATALHLHGDGSLAAAAPEVEAASTSFDFDPRDPVPTVGGNISSAVGILEHGAWDQRGGPRIWNAPDPIPLSARRDVLVFQSEPLEADLEVTGEVELVLWASSSAPDTDFTAKLVDVHPPGPAWPGGFDLLILDGIVRARLRDRRVERLLEPGRVERLTIRLGPTSNVFKRGHRIRVDVSSSNFPRFDVNPNTGEPLNRHRRLRVATNTIHHDRVRPSRLVLPVVG